MFEEGHSKIGGRKKGTPNKVTLIRADDLLLKLDINPIQKLIEIAESNEASLDQRINCYKEIAKYVLIFPPSHIKRSLGCFKLICCPGKNYNNPFF